jgi:hypothetical protein
MFTLCAKKTGYQNKNSYGKTRRYVILSIILEREIYRVKFKYLSRNKISVALETNWKLRIQDLSNIVQQ